MLWQHYVFRRGNGVYDLWDRLFENRTARLLYIAGRGFDTRAQAVMGQFLRNLRSSGCAIENAELVLISFAGYQLGDDLRSQTDANAQALRDHFRDVGTVSEITIGTSSADEEDLSASNALSIGTTSVLEKIVDQDHTDIILDVSSLPRVVYLALMTSILYALIPNRKAENPLWAKGVNFQVLVAEDPELDAKIRSEEPSNDLVVIPGFSSALNVESFRDWPVVWFPVLGEHRVSQLQKVMDSGSIPDFAEICPVLPYPSRNPRRADQLLIEYKTPLFDTRSTPATNILYAHESQPFEAYRQLYRAMDRYRESMAIIGGCRLLMTPLASKLITLGAGLACFEVQPIDSTANYRVAIPYAEPTRYVVSPGAFEQSRSEISTMLLTGGAYSPT